MEGIFSHLWIGFTGAITYPNAHVTRNSLLGVRSAHVVMETDAPYLPPQPFRGKTNYPEYIRYVYDYCAELLGKKINSFEEEIERNVRELYGI